MRTGWKFIDDHETADGTWHRLYVVFFPNGRIKIGMSANIPKRMSYYRQEARRHALGEIRYWESNPFPRKSIALRIEDLLTMMPGQTALRITGHREWFQGSLSEFDEIVERAALFVDTEIGMWMHAEVILADHAARVSSRLRR